MEGRIGETNVNKFGSKMTIIEYKKYNDVLVRFEQGNLVKTNYKDFKKGIIKNPYDKSVYNIGYFGEGKYNAQVNYKTTLQYKVWKHMLMRCYDEKFKEKRPTYKDCTVVEEWHNFQNFAKWYDENYYEIDGEKMNLDKDILYKGNKIYSPNTCVFVPSKINLLFVKRDSERGELPIGVSFKKSNNKYEAKYNNNGKGVYLGLFDTFTEAFEIYKTYKENLIKQIAEQYKSKIPKKLYDTLVKYKVEIND